MTASVLPVQHKAYCDDQAVALDVWAQVQRVQAGDKEAFGPLYKRYADVVFRFVYFRCGNRPLAEDLTSETFTKALKSIDSFTWQGRDFGAWLVTIARNLIADHFKSGRFRLEVTTDQICRPSEHSPEASDDRVYMQPEASAVDYISNKALLKLVTELNPEQQECIVLRFLRGLSIQETAQVMGKEAGAIKALQFRAVRSMARNKAFASVVAL